MNLLFSWGFFGSGFGGGGSLFLSVSNSLYPSLLSALRFESIVSWNLNTQGLGGGINSSERLLVDRASGFLGQERFDLGKDGGEVFLVQRLNLGSDFGHLSFGSKVGSHASVGDRGEGSRLADKSEGKNESAEHDDDGLYCV